MKKIIVIGATGSLAKYVIADLKKSEDVELTLFARNISGVPKVLSDGCNLIQGDATVYANLLLAIEGKDIVYMNLAGDLEAMAKNITQVMLETGVKRIIAISSIGIYETPLKAVLVPYRKLADVIELSGLDYTILRPYWFTDSGEVDYAITRKGEQEKGYAISRKSIAAFVAQLVQNPEMHKNENLGISKPNK
ncbi:MAG: NAD-dependent dehydratase [Pedobacter sp.]|nr:MAG: NAD-dependent dehydratase [Pedobacter sp.]